MESMSPEERNVQDSPRGMEEHQHVDYMNTNLNDNSVTDGLTEVITDQPDDQHKQRWTTEGDDPEVERRAHFTGDTQHLISQHRELQLHVTKKLV